MKKIEKCNVTCSWIPLPLSQTVTPSRTPSSVTYFIDGPYPTYICIHGRRLDPEFGGWSKICIQKFSIFW